MGPDWEEASEDRLLGGRVRLLQVRTGHRAGTDAVLLAGLCGARPREHVVDLGSASGAVGLMIAQRLPAARVSLVEREPGLVALARENIVLNGFDERVSAFERDVFAGSEPSADALHPHAEVPAESRPRSAHDRCASVEAPRTSPGAPQDDEDGGSFRPGSQYDEGGSFEPAWKDEEGRAPQGPLEPADLVVTNPPYFEEARSMRVSPDEGRRRAHVMEGGSLRDWLAAAARMLKPRGRLALIHRADALGLCLSALAPHFGAPAVMPIHPREGRNASRILVFARRGGRSPLVLLPPLILHEAGGRFTPEVARLHDPEAG